MGIQSIEFWELVVQRLDQNIIDGARQYMIFYLSLHSCSCPKSLVREWIEILNGDIKTVSAVLLATDLHSQDLKTAAPYILKDLVTDQERWDIHRRNR